MHRLLFVSTIAFAGGIVLRSFFDFGFAVVGAVLLLTFVLSILGLQHRSVFIGYTVLVCAAFGLGVVRMDVASELNTPQLNTQSGKETVLIGVITDEPDERTDHTKLTLTTEQIQTASGVANKTDRVLLITDRFPAFQYGDRLRVRGELVAPENYSKEEPGAPFDYVGYLAKDGIHYQMFYPDAKRIDRHAGSSVYAALFAVKARLLESVSRVLPEPHAALAGGITFGAKRALGEDLLERFRDTGLIHIVVLSGYNISIVIYALRAVLARTPLGVSIGVTLFAVAGFVIMVGAGATAVRAGIMAVLALAVHVVGRPYTVMNALFIAGILMVAHNPLTLLHDPSFQLSFMATLGLIMLTPHMLSFFGWMPSAFGLRDIAAATLATQLFVLPLILYMMGTISLIAPVANILVLPIVPFAMGFSAAAGVLGAVSSTLGAVAGWAAYALLSAITSVNEYLSALPFASVSVPQIPAWSIALFYGLLVAGLPRMLDLARKGLFS